MGNMTLFIAGIAILSLGTYLMRLGGAKLGNRLAFSERSQALLSDAATVLLFSVALATTFYEGTFRRYGARSGRCFRCVPRLAQGPADRRDYRRRRGDRAAAPGGYALGRVSVICKTAVLSGDRAFKPLNNRFDLQRVPLVYRQYRS